MKNSHLIKKEVPGRLLAVMLAIGIVFGFGVMSYVTLPAYAQENENASAEDNDVIADSSENVSMSSMLQATSHIDALAQSQDGADVVFSFEEGDTMFVTGESDGWYTVMYQGQTGYVKLGDGTAAGGSEQTAEEVSAMGDDASAEALNAEFAAVDQESTLVAEEVVRFHKNKTRSVVWGTIIVILVAGVFGTGIYSTIKANKKRKSDENVDSILSNNIDVEENTSIDKAADTEKKDDADQEADDWEDSSEQGLSTGEETDVKQENDSDVATVSEHESNAGDNTNENQKENSDEEDISELEANVGDEINEYHEENPDIEEASELETNISDKATENLEDDYDLESDDDWDIDEDQEPVSYTNDNVDKDINAGKDNGSDQKEDVVQENRTDQEDSSDWDCDDENIDDSPLEILDMKD